MRIYYNLVIKKILTNHYMLDNKQNNMYIDYIFFFLIEFLGSITIVQVAQVSI